jgi:hypothetical protein
MEHLTPYELDVLRSHRDKPQKASQHPDRREAQNLLASLGCLVRSDASVFSTTSKGLKRLAKGYLPKPGI